MKKPLMKRAFTLVELLVVLTIIALLVALLLPSLSTAREISRRVACASKMHQWSVGAETYATESKGLYPGMTMFNTYWRTDVTKNATWNSEQCGVTMNAYGITAKMQRCPSQTTNTPYMKESYLTANPPIASGVYDSDYWHFLGRNNQYYRYPGGPINANDPLQITDLEWGGWGAQYWNSPKLGPRTQAPVAYNNRRERNTKSILLLDLAWTSIAPSTGAWDNDENGYLRPSNHRGTGPYAVGENALVLSGAVLWIPLEGAIINYGYNGGVLPGRDNCSHYWSVSQEFNDSF